MIRAIDNWMSERSDLALMVIGGVLGTLAALLLDVGIWAGLEMLPFDLPDTLYFFIGLPIGSAGWLVGMFIVTEQWA